MIDVSIEIDWPTTTFRLLNISWFDAHKVIEKEVKHAFVIAIGVVGVNLIIAFVKE